MPAGQSDEANLSMKLLSPHVSLICLKLPNTNKYMMKALTHGVLVEHHYKKQEIHATILKVFIM